MIPSRNLNGVSRMGLDGRTAASGRSFRIFLTGTLISNLGSRAAPVALAFAALERGMGAQTVGFIFGAQAVPLVVFLFFGGLVADRWPRRSIMVAADILRFVSQGALALVLLKQEVSVVEIVALSAGVGVGNAFFLPGRSGFVREIVPTTKLQRANSLLAITASLSEIAGPALGGLLVGTFGAVSAIGVDAVTYLCSAACLMAVTTLMKTPIIHESLLKQIRSGWDQLRRRRWIWTVIIQFGFFHLFVFAPTLVLGALTCERRPGGAMLWGDLLATAGCGSVLAGLIAFRIRPRHPLRFALASIGLYGLAPASLAARWGIEIYFPAFFLSGVGTTLFAVLWDTSIQQDVPKRYLSSIAAYDMLGSLATLPIGYAIAAPLASSFGVTEVLWGAAGTNTILVLAALVSSSVRNFEANQHAHS